MYTYFPPTNASTLLEPDVNAHARCWSVSTSYKSCASHWNVSSLANVFTPIETGSVLSAVAVKTVGLAVCCTETFLLKPLVMLDTPSGREGFVALCYEIYILVL